MSRWQLSRKGQTKAEYKKILQTVLEPKFNELVEKADLYQLITPKLVYGYFPCNSEGNDLFIYQNKTDKTPIVIFNFPRQKMKNGFCIADYFLPVKKLLKNRSGFLKIINSRIISFGMDFQSNSLKHWQSTGTNRFAAN